MQSKYHNDWAEKGINGRRVSNNLSRPRSLPHRLRIAILAIVTILVLAFTFREPGKPTSPTPVETKEGNFGLTSNPTLESDKQGSLIAPQSPVKTKEKTKVAIVTFTTKQQSYTHLSLKNHDYYARKHGYDFIVDYEQSNSRGAMWHKFDMIEDAIHTNKYDWVWWMDFDTLITNTNVKVEDIIAEELANVTNPADIDFLFTPDCFELNAGSFITRAHPRSIRFFDRVREYWDANASKHKHVLSEQDCMRDLMFPPGSTPKTVLPPGDESSSSPSASSSERLSTSKTTTWVPESEFAERFIVIPQWRINAFPDEVKCWDRRDDPPRGWQDGSFVIHFAGAWAHMKEKDPVGLLMKKYEPYIKW